MSDYWQGEMFGQTVNVGTVYMAWAAMGITLVAGAIMTSKLTLVPSGTRQSLGEGVYDLIHGITFPASGKKGDNYLFIVGSLFMFVMIASLMGQLPLRLIELPKGELMPATADLNCTGGLALVTLVTYLVLSVKELGVVGFVKHHFTPWFMFPFHMLDHITRPGSLTLRLYANLMVGEGLSAAAMALPIPLLPSVIVMGMETFVACLQAYIFAMLSTIYISMMTTSHDHAHDAGHTH